VFRLSVMVHLSSSEGDEAARRECLTYTTGNRVCDGMADVVGRDCIKEDAWEAKKYCFIISNLVIFEPHHNQD